jgi:hypothetical protein
MTFLKFSIIFLFLFFGIFQTLTAQNQCEMTSKFELGIDFASFNKNWIYYNKRLLPVNINDYNLDFNPSFFARIHFEEFCLRFKYEHFKKNYLFRTNTTDAFEEVDGIFSNNKYFIGVEKYLINRRIMLSAIFDFGLSQTNFNGTYSDKQGGIGAIMTESFSIDGIGIFIQPGFGVKYRLFKNLFIDLESSIYLEKGTDKNDTHLINPQHKLIPRPISLLGFSTCF